MNVGAVAEAAVRFPRIRFQPRVSISGTLAGAVGGIGVVVHLVAVNAGRAVNV